MILDEFHKTITDQLDRLGGSVQVSVFPETRGYNVSLYLSGGKYRVSKFYTDTDVATYSPQLLRVQAGHLYNRLAQTVLDETLGEGVIYVR